MNCNCGHVVFQDSPYFEMFAMYSKTELYMSELLARDSADETRKLNIDIYLSKNKKNFIREKQIKESGLFLLLPGGS